MPEAQVGQIPVRKCRCTLVPRTAVQCAVLEGLPSAAVVGCRVGLYEYATTLVFSGTQVVVVVGRVGGQASQPAEKA